jgi:hypothetical protein
MAWTTQADKRASASLPIIQHPHRVTVEKARCRRAKKRVQSEMASKTDVAARHGDARFAPGPDVRAPL